MTMITFVFAIGSSGSWCGASQREAVNISLKKTSCLLKMIKFDFISPRISEKISQYHSGEVPIVNLCRKNRAKWRSNKTERGSIPIQWPTQQTKWGRADRSTHKILISLICDFDLIFRIRKGNWCGKPRPSPEVLFKWNNRNSILNSSQAFTKDLVLNNSTVRPYAERLRLKMQPKRHLW